MELAKLGDPVACSCQGGPHRLVSAASNTLTDGIPVARVGDSSSCGATIVTGVDWYAIEGAPAAIHGSATSCGGEVIATSSVATGSPTHGATMVPGVDIPTPRFNRRVVFKDEAGTPLVNMPYRLELESGERLEGMTNTRGEAEIADSRFVSAGVDIHIRR